MGSISSGSGSGPGSEHPEIIALNTIKVNITALLSQEFVCGTIVKMKLKKSTTLHDFIRLKTINSTNIENVSLCDGAV